MYVFILRLGVSYTPQVRALSHDITKKKKKVYKTAVYSTPTWIIINMEAMLMSTVSVPTASDDSYMAIHKQSI